MTTRFLPIVALSCLAVLPVARATLLVDNTGATNVTNVFGNGTGDDASSGSRGIGFTFPFYGTNRVSIYSSTNGRFNFTTTDTEFSNLAATTSTSSTPTGGWIAPWWDDLSFQNNAVEPTTAFEQKGNANIYAQTHLDNRVRTSGNAANQQRVSYQVALFGAGLTYAGFAFQTGDIALSYEDLTGLPTTGDFTIGVNKGGSPAVGASIPGDADGLLTYAGQTNLVPTGNTFVLFRYDATAGNYAASLQAFTPVPEPTAMAAAAVVGGALLRRRRAGR